jgi:hypothetical protein
VQLEERQGGSVDLATFVRARVPRGVLDAAAEHLGLSREAMWEKFEAAVAMAKRGERWRKHRDVLTDARGVR